MTMPHLMNCHHPEESWAWCLDCVKEMHDECERLHREDHQGFLEVTAQCDELRKENAALRLALKRAREYAVNKQKKHPLGIVGFANECGICPTQLSKWTSTIPNTQPNIF